MVHLPFHTFSTLNFRGVLMQLDRPKVMGILNLTPDSFSDGGQYLKTEAAVKRAGALLDEGASLIDIGGYSSRPGASHISAEEELSRILFTTKEILRIFPGVLLSVDTFRASVARPLLDLGVAMINDISAGMLDAEMIPLVARYQVPYVAMHMKGTPQNMQEHPQYDDVTDEVYQYFVERLRLLRQAGVHDIVLDPGFGFGKRPEDNLNLMQNLQQFTQLGFPLLVGISRKSMVRRLAGDDPVRMQEITDTLHCEAWQKGARLFRVHDVASTLKGLRAVVN